MKKSLNIIFYILITFIFLGCEKDKIEQNPTTTINFEVNKSNSDNNYSTTTVEEILNTTEKISHFWYGSDSVMLIQEIQFDIRLKNGDSINFGFWFIGYENPELLNLGEYDSIYFSGDEWDYINFDNEISNFYNGFREARILINNNVIFYPSVKNDVFKILKTEKVFTDGKYKTYLEIRFEGTAFGPYDPQGILQEVYNINNGIFKGIIE